MIAQAELPFGPVADDTAAILDLINGDPLHERDRAAVVDAIRAAARANHSRVNPNAVRRLIPEWVAPTVIGPTYRSLVHLEVLVPDGWVMSDDRRGRNSGKPVRAYLWTGGLET